MYLRRIPWGLPRPQHHRPPGPDTPDGHASSALAARRGEQRVSTAVVDTIIYAHVVADMFHSSVKCIGKMDFKHWTVALAANAGSPTRAS